MSGRDPLLTWLVDLDGSDRQLQQVDVDLGLLSADERAWSTPGAAELLRRRRSARIALRLALARAGAKGAAGGPFAVDPHGKPHMPGGSPAFSISHSGALALIAIAGQGPVGIDIEADGSRAVQLGAERRMLIIAAAQGLSADALPEKTPLIAAWTRLEAFAKARGTGIGALLTELGIMASRLGAATPEVVRETAEKVINGTGIGVAKLELPGGACGAVAAPRSLLAAPPPWSWLPLDDEASP